MEKPIEVPAIGFSTTVNVDGNRQITFQGFFDPAESDAVINARVDRIMKVADRQRSIYELPTLKAEHQKLTLEVAQYDQDVAQAEAQFKKSQAALDIQILETQEMAKEQFEEGYTQHRLSGRQGSYTPKGAAKANIERIQSQIEQIKATKASNEAEREQFDTTVGKSIEVRKAHILVLDQKIADLEKVLA